MNALLWLAISSAVWGGVLCLAATLLQRNNNLSGRMRQWIWRSAMMLLIAPWLAAPVVSALGLGLAPAEPVAVMAPAEAAPEMPAVVATFDQASPAGAWVVREDSGWMPPAISLMEGLMLIVMLGWVVRFVLAQLSARTLMGIVVNSETAGEGPARHALEAWSARLKLGRLPELRFAPGSVSPFSYGVFRPVIVLPEGLDRQLDAKVLDLVVGHECLHVARGDGWLRPLERVVADVMWFNPFAWVMRREADVARELAVDEGVVAISNARRAYARALRDVAGLAIGLPPSLPAASMSLAGSGRSLVLRMQRTLAFAKRKPARAAILAAAVLGVAGACTSVGQAMLVTPAAPAATAIAEPKLSPGPQPGRLNVSDDQAPVARVVTQPNLTPVVMRHEAPQQAAQSSAELQARLEAAQDALARGRKLFESGATNLGQVWELEDAVALTQAEIADVKAGVAPGKGLASAEAQLQAAVHRARAAKLASSFSHDELASYDDMVAIATAELADVKAGSEPGKGVASAEARLQAAIRRAEEGKRLFDQGSMSRDQLSTREDAVAVARAGVAAARSGNPSKTGSQTRPAPASPARPDMNVIPVQLQTPPATLGVALPLIKGATASVLKGEAGRLSGFGYRVDPFNPGKSAYHEGADFSQKWGAPVHTPADGTVTFAGTKGSYGRVVEIAMADGYLMRFGHLNSFAVKADQQVKAGDEVGTMGSTGRSTSPHLHVEVVHEGKLHDPETIPGLRLADKIVDAPYQPATPVAPATPNVTPPALKPIVFPQQTPTQPRPKTGAAAPPAPVYAPMKMRVVSVQPDDKGMTVALESLTTEGLNKGCKLKMTAMTDVKVRAEETIEQETLVGTRNTNSGGFMNCGMSLAQSMLYQGNKEWIAAERALKASKSPTSPVVPPQQPRLTPIVMPQQSAPLRTEQIKAPFAARVIEARKASDTSAIVTLQQTGPGKGYPAFPDRCTITYVVSSFRVATGQEVAEGDVVGEGGFGNPSRNSRCSKLVITQEGDTELPPKLQGAAHPIVGSPARFTSGFGNRVDPFDSSKSGFHSGVDIAKELGAPIYAPAAATVWRAEADPELGNVVVLGVEGGYTLRFSRLAEIKVKRGDALKAGDILGTMGSTGPSTGPHLHLETFWNGRAYNPDVVPGLTMIGPA